MAGPYSPRPLLVVGYRKRTPSAGALAARSRHLAEKWLRHPDLNTYDVLGVLHSVVLRSVELVRARIRLSIQPVAIIPRTVPAARGIVERTTILLVSLPRSALEYALGVQSWEPIIGTVADGGRGTDLSNAEDEEGKHERKRRA